MRCKTCRRPLLLFCGVMFLSESSRSIDHLPRQAWDTRKNDSLRRKRGRPLSQEIAFSTSLYEIHQTDLTRTKFTVRMREEAKSFDFSFAHACRRHGLSGRNQSTHRNSSNRRPFLTCMWRTGDRRGGKSAAQRRWRRSCSASLYLVRGWLPPEYNNASPHCCHGRRWRRRWR